MAIFSSNFVSLIFSGEVEYWPKAHQRYYEMRKMKKKTKESNKRSRFSPLFKKLKITHRSSLKGSINFLF